MRIAAFGLVLLTGLVLGRLGTSLHQSAQAQDNRVPQNSSNLIALSFGQNEGQSQVVLVDGQQRVMSVYHVDRESGAVTLKSVRNVQWDLLMEEYNAVNPLPRDVRAVLNQR